MPDQTNVNYNWQWVGGGVEALRPVECYRCYLSHYYYYLNSFLIILKRTGTSHYYKPWCRDTLKSLRAGQTTQSAV